VSRTSSDAMSAYARVFDTLRRCCAEPGPGVVHR